jgi:hypothetical protein
LWRKKKVCAKIEKNKRDFAIGSRANTVASLESLRGSKHVTHSANDKKGNRRGG